MERKATPRPLTCLSVWQVNVAGLVKVGVTCAHVGQMTTASTVSLLFLCASLDVIKFPGRMGTNQLPLAMRRMTPPV